MSTMTQNTATISPSSDLAASTSGVPFGRLVTVEARKLIDTRASRWLLGITVVSTIGMTVATVFILKSLSGHQSLGAQGAAGFVQLLGNFLIPVMAILLVCSEWSQRGALTTFLLEPRRTRVLGAKAVVALGASFVYAALAYALGLVSGAIAHSAFDTAALHGSAGNGLRFVAVNVLATASAFALALLIMNPAATIVTVLVLPSLLGMLTLVRSVQPLLEWVTTSTGQMAVLNNDWSNNAAAKLVVSSLIWIIIPAAVGVWRQMKTEVK